MLRETLDLVLIHQTLKIKDPANSLLNKYLDRATVRRWLMLESEKLDMMKDMRMNQNQKEGMYIIVFSFPTKMVVVLDSLLILL